VRIAAPLRMNLDTIRVFAISKLGWIRQQQTKLQRQEREPPREYIDRESHFVWGKRYLLKVIECDAAPSVELSHRWLVLRARPGTDERRRQDILAAWHRAQIKLAVPPLIAKWEPNLGVKVERFFVQRMKTKWGSCATGTGSIRLNTDLARKSPECLEYIVVHEMAHLLVRHHNDRFTSLVERCLPHWRLLRQALNEAPIAHADWGY
jgi:predicted metal-dependent hydrolase